MTTLKIKTVAELKAFTGKLRALQRTMTLLQKTALERSADETVLSDIHRDMESQNFSKKIIETTYVGPIQIVQGKSATIHFISDYVPDNGYDVGKSREEGSRDHMIIPLPGNKTGKLWWIDPRSGRLLNSKGHMVKGHVRYLTIERNIAKNTLKMQEAYENNIATSYRQVLGV